MNVLVENLSAGNTERVTEWMNLLSARGLWHSIWQPVQDENSMRVGLLLVGHVMSRESPEQSGQDQDERIESLWSVKVALTNNCVVCEMMEDLWTELPTMANLVSGSTLLHMAINLRDIHPNVVNPGFKNFLQMKQAILAAKQSPTHEPASLSEKAVNDAAYQFAELVNEVKHLDLDAGHWHELWEEGEAVGLAIILHYIKHEKRSRLEQLGRIRNVNACINSNIRKLRGALAAFPELVLELVVLWNKREDIAKHIDGDTLRELATDLRGNTARVQQCFEHLCRKLPERWGDEAGRAQKPTAYLYICVHNFIQSSDHRTTQVLHLQGNAGMHFQHAMPGNTPQDSPRMAVQNHGSLSFRMPVAPVMQHQMHQEYTGTRAPADIPLLLPHTYGNQAAYYQGGGYGNNDFRMRPQSVMSHTTTQTQTTGSSHPQSFDTCNSRPQSVMSDSTGSHSAHPESPVSSAVSQGRHNALGGEGTGGGDWAVAPHKSRGLLQDGAGKVGGGETGARCGLQDENLYDKVHSWLTWGGVWQNMPGSGPAMSAMNKVLV